MISIVAGQEMKATINSTNASGISRTKTLRYINPMSETATEANITSLVRTLMNCTTNNYISTRGTIDIGILSES